MNEDDFGTRGEGKGRLWSIIKSLRYAPPPPPHTHTRELAMKTDLREATKDVSELSRILCVMGSISAGRSVFLSPLSSPHLNSSPLLLSTSTSSHLSFFSYLLVFISFLIIILLAFLFLLHYRF